MPIESPMIDYRDYNNAKLDLYASQGHSFLAKIYLKNQDGTPMDITGYDVSSQIKQYEGTATVFPSTVEIINAVEGQIQLTMSEEQTALMYASRYLYQVTIDFEEYKIKVLEGQMLMENF